MVSAIKFVFSALILGVSTIAHASAMLPIALFKLIFLPVTAIRRLCDRWLAVIARSWVARNNVWFDAVNRTRWVVSGVENLDPNGWYLVISNHQSWMDILALQRTLHGRIPLLKFFIKKELIYVPVISLAWWALDFPFMRRRGGKSAQKDLEDARRACEKFRLIPTAVMSFAEGTRFTAAKHAQQRSPYMHLLRPKAGGVAMALETLGESFTAVLDVDLIYPQGVPSFQDALAGRVREVQVHVHQRPVPVHLLDAHGQVHRKELQTWIDSLWQEKDAALSRASSARAAQD